MAKLALRAKELVYRYPKAEEDALKGLSFELPVGSCTVVLGANGAGKTTLFNCLGGLVDRPKGVEFPAFSDRENFLSFGTQNCALYDRLSVRENLQLFSKLQRAKGFDRNEIPRLAEELGFGAFLDKSISKCSGGMKQRVHVAACFLGSPALMILDEPFNNIDPESKSVLKDWLKAYVSKKGGTLMMSSHQLGVLDDMWTHLLFLKEGRLERFFGRETQVEKEDLEGLFFSLNRGEA